MNSTFGHLVRAWAHHFRLQLTSSAVLAAVLIVLNFIYLSYQAFDHTVARWGRDLGLTVYLSDAAIPATIDDLKQKAESAKIFGPVRYVSKASATAQFLKTLGPQAQTLTQDPQWESPLPASLELKLSDVVQPADRVGSLREWADRLRALPGVDDVVYGQGWVENLGRFIHGVQSGMALAWILALGIGFLVVSNCIGLSILQRREEIEILELVGATPFYIRRPFLVEGLVLGLGASAVSLALSWGLHTWLIEKSLGELDFWAVGLGLEALPRLLIALNVSTAVAFGVLGAWSCVRRLNTQWSAAHHA